jgi:hypothetical protein
MSPVVNKWLDLLDRVGGTLLQVTGGVLIDLAVSDGNITWKSILFAGCLAVGKVLVGQNIGTDDTGSVVPNVIEPSPQDTNK